MIITRGYAKKLVRDGKAVLDRELIAQAIALLVDAGQLDLAYELRVFADSLRVWR